MKWNFIIKARLRYRYFFDAGPHHHVHSRWARMMFLFLLIACLQTNAAVIAQPITLSLKNASLETAIAAIKKQTGYNFIYTKELMQHTKKVSLDVQQESLEKVLELIFKEQPVTYAIIDRYVVIRKRADDRVAVQDGPITVKGRVVNEKGMPLASATVSVKGSSKSAATNEEGEFILKNVDEHAILLVSSVGYEYSEIPVNGQGRVNVQLRQKINELSVVSVTVNTGYQQVPKERATGSFVKIDNKLFNQQVSTDVLGRLEAVANGVTVDRLTTSPGIRIRGLSTINGPKEIGRAHV